MASGALTADVSAEVERLRAQHADAIREKSAAESKNSRLTEKVAALEAEKTDLRRQLVEERREANQAIAEAQAAQAARFRRPLPSRTRRAPCPAGRGRRRSSCHSS